MLLDQTDDARMVRINIQLLRTLEHDPDGSVFDLLFQVQPQSHALRMICAGCSSSEIQTSRFCQRSFTKNLRAEHRLSYPDTPTTIVVDPSKMPRQ